MNDEAQRARGLDVLLQRRGAREPLALAVPSPTTLPVLQGIWQAMEAGLVRPLLVGDPGAIRAAWGTLDAGAPPETVAPDDGESDLAAAIRLVADGRAQALAKGGLHTAELMRAVLRDLPGDGRVSHVFVLDLPGRRNLLLVTDAAVNLAPDLAAKAAIVRNAIALAQRLGIARPKVAALAAVAVVRPDMPSTVDAACLCKMAERGQIVGADVDGPLALDNAVSREAAMLKQIDGPVAGDADILLVPDIEAGNILVKALVHLAGAVPAGIVLGARVPVLLTSRADPPRARLFSAALAALVAGHEAMPAATVAATPETGSSA